MIKTDRVELRSIISLPIAPIPSSDGVLERTRLYPSQGLRNGQQPSPSIVPVSRPEGVSSILPNSLIPP